MEQELNDQMIQRREKLKKLEEMGVVAYPYSFNPTHTSEQIKNGKLVDTETKVCVAGRVVAIRGKGKTTFAHIKDFTGRIQIYIRKDVVGEDKYAMVKLLDIGDIVGITGPVFLTHTEELTVNAEELTLLSKSIRPLPIPKEKVVDGKKIVFDEFKDPELRSRQRYVDLCLNDNVRKTFVARSKIIKSIRNFLDNLGYYEVETPTLQSVYGGANANPFVTHHNALDMDLYLRISNELYLKKMLVGGFERVYEIVKDFRNEGIDRTHNPEFTMVEFYESYADYEVMMERFEQIYYQAAMEVLGTSKINYQGTEIELAPPWRRVKMADLVSEKIGKDVEKATAEDFKKILEDNNEAVPEYLTWGTGLNAVFGALCEKDLIQPTFVIDHPKETTPLCKEKRGDSRFVERFEPFINGWEVGNAYSELTNPILQYKLFKDQVDRRSAGEEETHPMDTDYVRAMEYGMPPAGGVGIGIDRMVMLLTNSYSVRDVILFPLMRPE